ncbi:MFS transporter [Novosphingobium aquiterrae]|uniref:MFS transporter n=1 Tax=Novosphingobium aquiterrae TaxID=624388 RepID=A0ABV6PMY2_9SPHN
MPAVDAPAPRQSARFLYLYALAACGGSAAYVPFLTILLPLRVAEIAPGGSLHLMARIAFAGAIAASLGNIVFGWASDRSQRRAPWIAAGLVLSCLLLAAMPSAPGGGWLICLIVAWQLALNLMLGPLAAWAGDTVPDSQKGLLGGLLALAPAAGALSGALVTWQGLVTAEHRPVWLAGIVAAMVAPLLVLGRPRPMPQLMAPRALADVAAHASLRAVWKMWLARLLVQVSEASLFAFLLLWLRQLDPAIAEHRVAALFTAVLAAAVVVALSVGRWSDRHDRPIEPLAACAAIAASGLLIMTLSRSIAPALIGYVVFGLSSSVFLALHSTQTLRVLPQPQHRGRDLGLFNLTNTGPSLIMPWLVLALVPRYGFPALFIVLTVLAASAAIILALMARAGRATKFPEPA